jgi:DinB superfamily
MKMSNTPDQNLLEDLKVLYLREIATLERELDLYPDDASVWKELPGLPNPAGNLLLHLAGSLQHFFGATFGKTLYQRNREAEFTKRNVSRSELKQELFNARKGVQAAFANLTEDSLTQVFPVQFADVEFSTRLTLLQFLSHLAYHLGQIDYHRRVVTGSSASANAIAASDLIDYIEHTRQGSV